MRHLERLAKKVRGALAPEFGVMGDPTFCAYVDGTWSVEVHIQPKDRRKRPQTVRSAPYRTPKQAVDGLISTKAILVEVYG